jgi:hypothetical protein
LIRDFYPKILGYHRACNTKLKVDKRTKHRHFQNDFVYTIVQTVTTVYSFNCKFNLVIITYYHLFGNLFKLWLHYSLGMPHKNQNCIIKWKWSSVLTTLIRDFYPKILGYHRACNTKLKVDKRTKHRHFQNDFVLFPVSSSFYCNAIFFILTYWFNFDNTILNRVFITTRNWTKKRPLSLLFFFWYATIHRRRRNAPCLYSS